MLYRGSLRSDIFSEYNKKCLDELERFRSKQKVFYMNCKKIKDMNMQYWSLYYQESDDITNFKNVAPQKNIMPYGQEKLLEGIECIDDENENRIEKYLTDKYNEYPDKDELTLKPQRSYKTDSHAIKGGDGEVTVYNEFITKKNFKNDCEKYLTNIYEQ